MKKALIVIALLLVLCSVTVSAIPFRLVAGKQGFKSIDVWSVNPFNFEFNFPNTIFVDHAYMQAFKEYNRCGGYWLVDVYDSGKHVETSAHQDICKRNGDCFRIANMFLTKADTVVVRSEHVRNHCSRGNCHPSIAGNIFFIEGNDIKSAITSRSGIVELGKLSDILKDVSYTETTGDEIIIKTDNPRVLAWIGSQNDYDNIPLVTRTDDDDLNLKRVWACYDGDLNQKCDYNEDTDCLAAYGDYYKGVCCGADITGCGYVGFKDGKQIDAFCSQLDDGYWAWIAKENVGEIFSLDSSYCPAKSFVSDGTAFLSPEKLFEYYIEKGFGLKNPLPCAQGFTEIDFLQAKQIRICAKEELLNNKSIFVSTKYGSHEYIPAVGELFECAANFPFSTHNNASLGSNTQSLSGLVCPVGMVIYYPMEDTVNNFVSSFMHGSANDVSFTGGKSGKAAVFDSPSSDIEIAPGALNLQRFGFEAWINPSSVSGRHIIFNSELSVELYLDNNTLKASLYTDDVPNGVFLKSANNINTNSWSYVVLSYDGSDAKLYLDGFETDSKSLTGNLRVSSLPFVIGARSFVPNEPFEGLIDEVAIYSKAIEDSLIQSHYSQPGSYCGVSTFDEIFYCAADGDWTKDLDIKDSISCHAAGFDWTGHKCCSEADDPGESYSDYSIDATKIDTLILAQNKATKTSDYEILLEDQDSFVTLSGPSLFLVTRSYWSSERGDIVKCIDKNDVIASFDLEQGQSKKFINLFYPDELRCKIGKTTVTSLPFLASGGCFDKTFYPTGSFLYGRNIINYRGEFIACKQTPLDYQSYDFIGLKDSHCGYPLLDILPEEHAVCLPGGSWYLTKDAEATVVDDTLWDPITLNVPDAVKFGCCPVEQCWNGTGCQPVNTFYRVQNQGFVCK